MTKADIVFHISKSTGIDKIEVIKIVELFMASVQGSLEKGEHVFLRDFGSFVIKKRAETTARNFSKNTTMIIPECNIPVFKPSDSFTVK